MSYAGTSEGGAGRESGWVMLLGMEVGADGIQRGTGEATAVQLRVDRDAHGDTKMFRVGRMGRRQERPRRRTAASPESEDDQKKSRDCCICLKPDTSLL